MANGPMLQVVVHRMTIGPNRDIGVEIAENGVNDGQKAENEVVPSKAKMGDRAMTSEGRSNGS